MHERLSSGQAASSPDFLRRHERLIAALIVTAFVALAVGYSLGPIFEPPDEPEHYRFMYFLGETGRLPDRKTHYEEFQQPPLYYALGALIRLPFDDSDFERIVARRNPAGIVTELLKVSNWHAIPNNYNRNYFIHTRAESFPYLSGTARAVHLFRLFSVILGAGTLLTSYGIFRILWPERPDRRLAALGIIAFWPGFNYLSGYITNDNLIIFLSTLSVFLALLQLRDGPSIGRAVIQGIVLGAALLTKISAAMLVVPFGVSILLGERRAWQNGLISLAIALAISGWWYIQGAILYNDPTGLRMQYEVIPGASTPLGQLNPSQILPQLFLLYQRLWARFGKIYLIVVSPVIYVFFDLLTTTGVIGAILATIRWIRSRRIACMYLRLRLVVVTWGVTVLVAVLIFAMTTRLAFTPRYLMPGIAAWGGLLAYGLDFWIPRQLKTSVTLIETGIMVSAAATCMLGYFLPAYQPLPLPPRIEHPLAIHYENAAELIGTGEGTIYARPGEIITVTFYWRAIQPTDHDLLTFVRANGLEPPILVSVPATGNLNSTEWHAGQTWAEGWQVYIPPDISPKAVYLLTIGLYDPTEQRQLIPTDDSGQISNPLVIRIILDSSPKPTESR